MLTVTAILLSVILLHHACFEYATQMLRLILWLIQPFFEYSRTKEFFKSLSIMYFGFACFFFH